MGFVARSWRLRFQTSSSVISVALIFAGDDLMGKGEGEREEGDDGGESYRLLSE